MNCCFFETDYKNVDRYYTEVLGPDIRPVLILFQGNENIAAYHNVGKYKDVAMYSISSATNNEIKKWLTEHHIDVLIINGQRIPDIRMTVIARNLGIRICYIQHGLYIPFMKRSISFFIKKSIKTYFYLKDAVYAGVEHKNIKLPFLLFAIHVFGVKRGVYKEFNIFPDKAFVISKYWENWHREHYAFPQSIECETMGMFDFTKYKSSEPLGESTISYCYQTLVEDGRLDEKIMMEFYINLLDWIKRSSMKLVVKGHPRMNSQFISFFEQNGIPIYIDTVPATKYVIGHYSSLLPFWVAKGSQVIAIPLHGHPIPESIASWSFVVEHINELNINDVENNLVSCEEIYGKGFSRAGITSYLNK